MDTCDLDSGEVRQVTAHGEAELVPFDPARAKRKLARYLGPDEVTWDHGFLTRYVRQPDPETRFVRLAPERLTARDFSYRTAAARAPRA